MFPFDLIVTVGPKSLEGNVLKGMQESGADCFRINLSHSNETLFQMYLQKMLDTGIKPGIDTQGAQGRIIRTAGKENLKINESVIFKFGDDSSKEQDNSEYDHIFYLNHEEIIEQVEVGDILRVDFAGLIIRLNEINKREKVFTGSVTAGGTCDSNRAFDIANKPLKLNAHTNLDLWALEQSKTFECPAIFHSFAQSADDILKTRSLANKNSKIIAKIESIEGLKSIEEIGKVSDAILIDRGDLSREISISMIPAAVNMATKICQEINKPIYVATNVLDSLMSNALPSRAEISDIHNMLSMGVTGVVLAAEAAIGERPVESVQVVNHIRKIVKHQKLGLLGVLSNENLKGNMNKELKHWL